jgi:serine/threonine protein phosphatase PrpC
MIKQGVPLTEGQTRINGMVFRSVLRTGAVRQRDDGTTRERERESCTLLIEHFVVCTPTHTHTYIHRIGLAVSRALGDHFVKFSNMGLSGEPHISAPIKIEPSDEMVIIASDGVCILSVDNHTCIWHLSLLCLSRTA